MRLFRQSAAIPTETQPHAATWARQPRFLARNEADAVATIIATIAACLTAAVCIILGLLLGMSVRIVYVAAVVVMEAIGVLVVWVVVYAAELRSMSRDVRRATWQQDQPRTFKQDGGWVVNINRVMTIDGKPEKYAATTINLPVPPKEFVAIVRRMMDGGAATRRQRPDGVGPETWQKIIYALEEMGGVEKIPGKGTVFTDRIEAVLKELESAI